MDIQTIFNINKYHSFFKALINYMEGGRFWLVPERPQKEEQLFVGFTCTQFGLSEQKKQKYNLDPSALLALITFRQNYHNYQLAVKPKKLSRTLCRAPLNNSLPFLSGLSPILSLRSCLLPINPLCLSRERGMIHLFVGSHVKIQNLDFFLIG